MIQKETKSNMILLFFVIKMKLRNILLHHIRDPCSAPVKFWTNGLKLFWTTPQD